VGHDCRTHQRRPREVARGSFTHYDGLRHLLPLHIHASLDTINRVTASKDVVLPSVVSGANPAGFIGEIRVAAGHCVPFDGVVRSGRCQMNTVANKVGVQLSVGNGVVLNAVVVAEYLNPRLNVPNHRIVLNRVAAGGPAQSDPCTKLERRKLIAIQSPVVVNCVGDDLVVIRSSAPSEGPMEKAEYSVT